MPKIIRQNIVENREFRRQQLMAAATELALTKGARFITVAAVARKAGVARSSLYEYFSSSSDLIANLIIDELEYFTERLDQVIKDDLDPYQKIENWISEGLQYVVDGRHMLVKTLNSVAPPDDRKNEIALGHKKLVAPLRQALLATGVADLQQAASFISGVTDAASVRIESGFDAALEIQNAKDFAIAGIRALVKK